MINNSLHQTINLGSIDKEAFARVAEEVNKKFYSKAKMLNDNSIEIEASDELLMQCSACILTYRLR